MRRHRSGSSATARSSASRNSCSRSGSSAPAGGGCAAPAGLFAQAAATRSRRRWPTARNRAVGHLRRERVAAAWAKSPAGAAHPPPAGADEPLREHELRDALERAVAELPERCRLIFTLSRYRSLSNAEIARMLCISVNTVEQQMWRALKTLRAKLAPYLQ